MTFTATSDLQDRWRTVDPDGAGLESPLGNSIRAAPHFATERGQFRPQSQSLSYPWTGTIVRDAKFMKTKPQMHRPAPRSFWAITMLSPADVYRAFHCAWRATPSE